MTVPISTRPKHVQELATMRRQLEHVQDQLAKSRRFTALVGAAAFLAGMVFMLLVAMPPAWTWSL